MEGHALNVFCVCFAALHYENDDIIPHDFNFKGVFLLIRNRHDLLILFYEAGYRNYLAVLKEKIFKDFSWQRG
jgi:hypothetical protein